MPALLEAEVALERDLSGATFAWPERPDADELEGNHFYQDLRGFDWDDVRATVAIERRLISDFTSKKSQEEGASVITALRDSRNPDRDGDPWGTDPLWGLDAGICSTVMALSAAGCVPFSSCNGGVFGDSHVSACPVVAFFMRRDFEPTLIQCASKAGVGVRPFGEGKVQVYASSIEQMITLAELLILKLDTDNSGITSAV